MVKTIKIKTPQKRKIEELEKENNELKLQLNTLNQQSNFLEQTLLELIMTTVP